MQSLEQADAEPLEADFQQGLVRLPRATAREAAGWAFANPSYEQRAQEAAHGVGEFVSLEEAVPDWEERVARARRS
ncbi:hypothetical protein ACFYOK_36585 [Microbispora bryophytorum]|uniref:hypothetical protein n=1 Tax=Microbispora bryophytorum TaxID=1460882 RepID=UPI0033D3ABC3